MSAVSTASTDWRASSKSWIFAVALLVLTSIHHAYGALVYHSEWRLHVVFVAIPLAAVIIVMARSRERSWRIYAALLMIIFAVMLIGVFEGGYNHLVKNIVYFTAGADRTRALFPPPLYELPGDAFFELTGIAQFLIAPFAALGAVRLLREAMLL
ncbi:MAG TPA: hypothetical protein VE968_04650 [Sphingomicrobium sp.]|nr:hypothetical protein [Sphingomicrobium sp.]